MYKTDMSTAAQRVYSMQGCTYDHSQVIYDTTSFTPIPGDTLIVHPTNSYVSPKIGSMSRNNLMGHFLDIPLFFKQKLTWEFADAKGFDEVEAIFDKIESNLKNHSTRIYKITTWAPGLGWRWGYFYLGAEPDFKSVGVAPRNGQSLGGTGAMPKYELHMVEVGDESTDIPNPYFS